ncbi:hypothetical protein DFH29DRAFT_997875 [Suillus ampliporus]|nr:hypothetical protein DFH29DRAFT_997875 [Suillus ampliporus]
MPPRKPTSKQAKTSVPSPPHSKQPLVRTTRGRPQRPTEKENYQGKSLLLRCDASLTFSTVSEMQNTVCHQATKEKRLEKQKKRALKATYQDNPDVFEKEPSELLSDSDRDEDTMARLFSDHALQMKLSNTKVLEFSAGKIPPASRTTSGSSHKLKAPAINTPQDDPPTTLDDTSDESSDDSETTNQSQPEAGAGQADEEDEDAMAMVKIKKNSDGSCHRMKAGNFDDDSKDILVTATSIFCCLIVTQAPSLDTIAVETKLGKEACQMKGINVKLTPLAVKMLLNCTSHVRCELKTKMQSLTRLFFGFRSGDSREVIRQNRDLAESLKDGSSFVFKDWTVKTGIYKTELLQDGINVMWFANRSDKGIVHNKYFNPMPIEVIALTLTAIQCCIDKWLQGMKEDIKFTATTYGSVYQTHLSSLQRFNKRMAPYKLFERICDNLHNVARFHAGVETLTTVSDKSRISDEAFEDAIREHQLEEEGARRG